MASKKHSPVTFRRYLALVMCLLPCTAQADHFVALGIVGVPAAAIVGSWPVNSNYSWLSNRFPDASISHSWRLHPGSDGGIVLANAQPYGALTAEFLMFNVNTALYSTEVGITIDSSETVNLDKLIRQAGNNVFSLGSASGANPLVPLVQDITLLAPGENGWQLNPDGSYHLIFNTVGTCPDCDMKIHFYGSAIPLNADGDVNIDGNVDITDVLLAERYLHGLTTLTPEQLAHGDLSPSGQGNGILSVDDVYLLYKLIQQQ